ncbi:MAG TPA: CHASE3 domain-containing protein [Caulobacteraceae bacterium]
MNRGPDPAPGQWGMPVWLRHPSWLLGLAFAILAALLLAAVMLTEGQRQDETWVHHSLQVQNQIYRVLTRLEDAETGQRGFVITGNERFLEPYTRALSIQDDVDALAKATSDNPVQQKAVTRLRRLVRQDLDILGRGIQLRRADDFVQAAEQMKQGSGKALMDETRGVADAMIAQEQDLLARRQAHAAATRFSLQCVLALGFAGIVALTFFAVRQTNQRLLALHEANARLTAEAEARAKAEDQMRQMQKMEAVGQLTGGIAHDFNNMLAVVIGSLDLARRRFFSDPDRTLAGIDNAMEGAARAAALTARLLAFSRQQPLAPSPLDPNRLVSGMSELLRRTIGENMNLETVLAGGVWRVNADSQQLENSILNLCVNARDAMPDGGRLTIETANTFLDDTYAAAHGDVASGQYVLISVSDTGAGMTPEVMQRAFDPFYTTKGVGQGTGLGLSQVFGFVKQSGGHVKIYSEVGQGTSVKIYLPRWTGEATDTVLEPPKAERPTARAHETVLVVEDDEKVRHVTVDTLRELGYTVVPASSGNDALKQLKLQPRIDLLLTDIIMPGMTGRALADTISQSRPDLKILYMTGYTRNAIIHNGVLDPGVAFLQKPFTGQQLAVKVRQVLDGQGANRLG